MRKLLLIIVIVFGLSFSVSAYSFVEFPQVDRDDFFLGCNFIFRDADGSVFWFTSENSPQFTHQETLYKFTATSNYKLYLLNSESNYWQDISFYMSEDYYTFAPHYQDTFLCSDIEIFFMYYQDFIYFGANSLVPLVNYNQLSYREQVKINEKLETSLTITDEFKTNNQESLIDVSTKLEAIESKLESSNENATDFKHWFQIIIWVVFVFIAVVIAWKIFKVFILKILHSYKFV